MLKHLFFAALLTLQAPLACQPEQPETGPGGKDYITQVFTEASYGSGADQFWIFSPTGVSGPRPVVAFLHGWAAWHPDVYRAWIEHLTKKGNIVIFPRYQLEGDLFDIFFTQGRALAAIQQALVSIGSQADPLGLTYVSHSWGGVLAFNLAANATTTGLPPTAATCYATPGDNPLEIPKFLDISHADQISASAYSLLIVAADDGIPGTRQTAETMLLATTHLLNQEMLEVQTDEHGEPDMRADHYFPLASGDLTDAVDYFATWKLCDAVIDCRYRGQNCNYAFGGTPEQLGMGEWSDSVPVAPMVRFGSTQ